MVFKHLCHLRVRRVPTVAHKHCAASYVNVCHGVRAELQPIFRSHHTLETTDDAIDPIDAVQVEHHDDFPYHRVESGAESTASNYGGSDFFGIEVEKLAWASQ
eukprot:CAMPEP_0115347136 /NCGR_PEP_ID=MMETSP0270-20121206/94714_1 /TAXON_ID=71861 /ORGANISM="Scrippsiella trochoidea, Strain CCMP3099" /LENGTH=102 /DNA_ID=CAMNT_0002769027 /DNA_START=247 /DNA_END=555 /DNA_ORIENTATION=-